MNIDEFSTNDGGNINVSLKDILRMIYKVKEASPSAERSNREEFERTGIMTMTETESGDFVWMPNAIYIRK